MTKDKWFGHLAILTTNLIFGLNTPIAKTMVPEWISPYALTLLRMSFAAIVFWIAGLFFKKEKVSKKDLVTIFFAALFGLVAAQLTFAQALIYTSPVNISTIAAMTPIVVMLLAALLLKEPITMKKTAGVLIGAAGGLLIIFQGGKKLESGDILGNLFAVVNIVTYGLYLVISRPISQRYSPFTLMKWMFLFSALISLPLGFSDLTHARVFSNEANTQVILSISYTVILATGVTYFLVPVGLKRIRPTTVSMYNNIQPIVASTVAIIVGQDVWSWNKPVAAVLIFIGVYLVTQSRSRADILQDKP